MNPILALIITNVIWGAASPIFKLALTNVPPFTLAFLRFGIAAAIFFPALFLIKHPHTSKHDYMEILLGTFIGIVLHISFFFLGLERTASINVPVISSTGPMFLFFLSVIFLKEKPQRKILVGMLIGLMGALLIMLRPIFGGVSGPKEESELLGNILILFSTIALATEVLIFKDILKRVRTVIATFWSFLFAAFCFLPLAAWELKEWSFAELNLNGVIGIIFGSLFSSGIAFLFYYYGVKRIKGQEVGIFAYISPVVTVLVAMPLLGEYPDVYFLIGSLLVFGGVYIAEEKLHWHPLHRVMVHHFGKPGGKEIHEH